jgi:hypothetical protein
MKLSDLDKSESPKMRLSDLDKQTLLQNMHLLKGLWILLALLSALMGSPDVPMKMLVKLCRT